MYAFLMFIHVVVCLFLVVVVLLQPGRGGIGPSMGGGGQQVFGGGGAGNVLTKATTAFAVVFMFTSISLAYLSSSGSNELKTRAEERKKVRAESLGVTQKPAEDAKPVSPGGAN